MTISLARANGSTVEISFGAVLSQDPPEHLSKAFSAVNALRPPVLPGYPRPWFDAHAGRHNFSRPLAEI